MAVPVMVVAITLTHSQQSDKISSNRLSIGGGGR